MATAGYGMKFGKGYLDGGRSEGKPAMHEEPADMGEGDGGSEAIRAHLEERHAATGHAHSHVEHHGDGRHTSHHISAAGEHSGPHDHENLEALKSHMDQFLNEEGQEGGGEHESEEME